MSKEQKNSRSGESLLPLTPYTSLLTIALLNKTKKKTESQDINQVRKLSFYASIKLVEVL